MLIAILLAASPAVHLGISTGIGTGYGYAGPRLELSAGSLTASAGLGLYAEWAGDAEWATGRYNSSPGLPLAFALRWTPGEDRGFFTALSAAWFPYSYPTDDLRGTLHGDRYSLTLTAGYRLAFTQHFFGDLALGAGAARAVDAGPTSYLGTIGPPRHEIEFQPDAAAAVGVRF